MTLWKLWLLAGALVASAACASSGRTAPPTTPPGTPPAVSTPATAEKPADPPARSPTAPANAPLWEIPATDLLQQRLFRLRYGGPEGEGSFRLTLRLAAPDRYRVTTVDAVGRAVWSLSVEGEEGLWIDHRRQRFCRFHGAVGLAAVPLEPFALPALPSVLLGRLPVAPRGAPHEDGSNLEFEDASGRRWTAHREGERLLKWTFWEQGEPAIWWSRQGEESVLSEREQGIQLRWRQVLAEPIAELPPAPAVPDGYAEGCEEASNPASMP